VEELDSYVWRAPRSTVGIGKNSPEGAGEAFIEHFDDLTFINLIIKYT
jgi:hypothetical protein